MSRRRCSSPRRACSRAVVEADPAHYVRGQYDGYRSIDGVASDSTTETYAALRREIKNWRWSGVPAAMVGESTRSTRQDGVEETWRIMQPLLDAPPPVHPYAPGSWGPDAAAKLVAGHGRWRGPWVTA